MTGPLVEAVIFDWGGTLTPWHTVDARLCWLAYAGGYFPAASGEQVAAVAGRLHRAEDAAWDGTRYHHRSATIHDVVRAAGIEPVGDAHGVAMAAYEAAWEPHTWTDADADPTLRALRERGLKIGLLSNTLWSRDYHERILTRDGVLSLFDGSVFSSEIPWAKPHPQAFLAAMDAVAVTDPARVVFVGDRPFDDIHGARGVGMRAVLVPHSDIPLSQRGHTQGESDAVVGRLADLVGVVDEWMAPPPFVRPG